MSKRNRYLLICLILLLGGAVLFYLYTPRPIVSDLDNSRIFLLMYNPAFEQDENRTEPFHINAYDEKAVLECLSRYTEQRTFRKSNGFGQINMQFHIILSSGNTTKTLVLGNDKTNYLTKDGSTCYRIKDGDALRAELMEIIQPPPVDLSVYHNVELNTTLRLGMSKKEVEQHLGPGTFFDREALLNELIPQRSELESSGIGSPNTLSYYTNGTAENGNYIFLTYEQDTLVGLTVCPPTAETPLTASSWQNPFGLSYGDRREDIMAACGEASATMENMTLGPYDFTDLIYFYDAKGALLEDQKGAAVMIEYLVEEQSNTLFSYNLYRVGTP